MASLLKVPSQEAAKVLQKPGRKLAISEISRKTGIPKATLHRYVARGFENAPFWAVCKVIRYLGMEDEDRLALIRCYTGEKHENKTGRAV